MEPLLKKLWQEKGGCEREDGGEESDGGDDGYRLPQVVSWGEREGYEGDHAGKGILVSGESGRTKGEA